MSRIKFRQNPLAPPARNSTSGIVGDSRRISAVEVAAKAFRRTTGYGVLGEHSMARYLGSSCKGMSVPPWVVTTSATPVDGRLYFIPVVVPYHCTLSGALYASVTTGNFTYDNNNKIGVYTSDGTTLTRQAQTVTTGSSGALWKRTANDIVSESFSATYAATPGVVYVAILRNESANVTPPTIGITAAYLAAFQPCTAFAMTGSNFISGGYVAATDLPATQAISGLTKFNQTFWVGLY